MESPVCARKSKRKRQASDTGKFQPVSVQKHACGWWLCPDVFDNFDDLMQHVLSHIEPYKDTGAVSCMWKGCDLPSEVLMTFDEAARHLSFHVHHSQLKYFGNCFLRMKTTAVCKQQSDKLNSVLFSHLTPFVCRWDTCQFSTNIIADYYRHVAAHVNMYPPGRREARDCCCLWTGCNVSVGRRSFLCEHLRVHTMEKVVSCSVCGGLFSNKEKLLLHVERQKPATGNEKLMCSFCHKSFPTQSLLLQHVYHHVNHYQCPFCGFTVRAPSDLRRHVFNKHQNEKPFFCSEESCGACFKAQYDLKRHFSNVHQKETKFECFAENCTFSCIHFAKLVNHLKQDHKELAHPQPQYACHLCDNVFNSSAPLSKHLKTAHNVTYPEGTGRFRFVLDTDGFYRMQVERVNQLKEFVTTDVAENCGDVYQGGGFVEITACDKDDECYAPMAYNSQDVRCYEEEGAIVVFLPQSVDLAANVNNQHDYTRESALPFNVL